MIKELILFSMSPHWESFPVSRSTKDLELSTLKEKTGPRDLILFQPWPNNFTNLDADLLSGELFYKSEKKCHLIRQFNKTLGFWRDTQLFVNKTVWFQLLSLKFYQMVHIQQNTVKKLLKKSWQPFSTHYNRTMSCWKVASWNQTWLRMDQLTGRKSKTIFVRNQSEQFELCQDQFHQP